MMIKKLLCIFLCIVTVCTLLCACKKEEATDITETTEPQLTTSLPEKEREITLGYFKSKGFNPYKTESPLNRSLLTLVYDSLFLMEDGYSVSPLIASHCSRENRKLTVHIKDELYFSDGSTVDAKDVVYSFNLAKDNSYYKGRLSNISSATASEGAVIFTVEREDLFAESCLTFPIVKAGTGYESIPIGSGRYTLKKKDGSYYLSANENTTRKEEMTTKKISLVPVSAEESELYLLQTGDLTYFFDDLSDGKYIKIGANTVKIPLNNLVFVSFNRQGDVFSDESLVKAVNCAIDRTGLCDSVYEGMYRKPKSVFNPDWYMVSAVAESANPYNIQQAESILKESGYIYAYSHNAYRSKNFVFLEMDLLVCNNSKSKTELAAKIEKSLKSIGIKVNVHEKEYEEYTEALKKGEFDLYIGEIKLSANMSLHPFFSKNGAASYGIKTDSVVSTAYYDFIKGAVDVNTFVQIFEENLPFIPLCYRDGLAYYSRELSYEGTVNEYEPFKNIYSWEV